MIQPPFLRQGDKVIIISTARKVAKSEVTDAISILQSWGLEVLLGKNLFAINNQFAGTDQERGSDLQSALDNPEIKAIICARGGYGTTRILDLIDFSTFINNPKWVVGFSDVTALHCQIQKVGIQSVHATMPLLFTKEGGKLALETLKSALFGDNLTYTAEYNILNRIGESEAEVIGGNLSILNHILGTDSDIDYDNKILFLEDLDEYLYHIDRLFLHLKRCKKLNNLKGLVIGHFSKMNDNAVPFGKTAYEIIAEHVKEFSYPVAFGFPVGHEPDNRAFICGATAKLSVTTTKSEVTFLKMFL